MISPAQYALAGESCEEDFKAAFAFRSHTPEGHMVDKIELISEVRGALKRCRPCLVAVVYESQP